MLSKRAETFGASAFVDLFESFLLRPKNNIADAGTTHKQTSQARKAADSSISPEKCLGESNEKKIVSRAARRKIINAL